MQQSNPRPNARPTLLVALLGALSLPAFAQNQPVSPRDSALQNNLPQPPGQQQPAETTVRKPQVQRMSGNADAPLTIEHINIAGVRSIPADEAFAVFRPLVHQHTTVGALVDAADRLTQLYKSHGYALSYAYVPAQDTATGSVQVVAVEGYVRDLQLKNAPPVLESKIRSIVAPILSERPLRTATFERYVSLLARLPALKVDANVPVPDTMDGATELQLAFSHKRIATTASFDSNHPGFEAVLGASINGITSLGDQLTVSVMAPRGDLDKHYYALDYGLPLGSDGAALRVSAYDYVAKDLPYLFDGAALQQSYRDRRVTAVVSYPLVLRADRSLFVEAGGYSSTTGNVFTQPPFLDVLDLRAHVRALQGGLNASLQTRTSSTEGNVQVAHGFDRWGARQDADLIDLDFLRVRSFVRRNDTWMDGKFTTFFAATAQQSSDRLPLTEKITFGGNFFGAGYRPGEMAGDRGWGVSGEVSKPFPLKSGLVNHIEPYLGFDYAQARTTHVSLQPDALTSAAVGVRFGKSGLYQLSLSAAKPVGAAPILEPGRPWRFNLQGSVSF